LTSEILIVRIRPATAEHPVDRATWEIPASRAGRGIFMALDDFDDAPSGSFWQKWFG
jgi:hypothetical protein